MLANVTGSLGVPLLPRRLSCILYNFKRCRICHNALVKSMPWCKIIRISLILERSDIYGYKHEPWLAELVMVVVVGSAGYNMEEKLSVIHRTHS